jgi:signal peptidase II
MKGKNLILLILLVVLADQVLKIYIKTTFHLHASTHVFGDWFQLYFVENPGMAYGWKFGGVWGKVALTVFRMGAVVFGSWYLAKILKLGYAPGFIACAGMIYAGALGNLIDSSFYGMIFDKGMTLDVGSGEYLTYPGLATFSGDGYSGFLHGNVVDMFYFPIIKGHFPEWFPLWGGEYFEFFRPIFNLADASISCGVISILVFQKRFFRQQTSASQPPVKDQ